MAKIQKVAIVGTGVIGAGWIIRCLAHNKIVYAYDKDIKLKKNLFHTHLYDLKTHLLVIVQLILVMTTILKKN